MVRSSAPRPLKLSQPSVREHAVHARVARVLSLELAPPGRVSRDGVIWWSCDIADHGGAVPGARIGRGIIGGVPDVYLLHLGRAYHIEIKTDAPHSVLSDAQRLVAAGILVCGGHMAVARDEVEVLAALDAWGIPRNRRVRVAA